MARPRQILYRHFSPETNLLYVLIRDGEGLANLEISGIRMKSATPSIEAVLEASLREISPLVGACLDTCGGLGYSAIAMARALGVTRVHCFERDVNVVEAARHNPDSAALFEDRKIDLRLADVCEGIDAFPAGHFDRVFHDPPRLGLAGELYSGAFYAKLYRVLRPGGRLFHYTGSPGEKAGKRVRQGVASRLREAGFEVVRDCHEAQGLSAVRPAPRRES